MFKICWCLLLFKDLNFHKEVNFFVWGGGGGWKKQFQDSMVEVIFLIHFYLFNSKLFQCEEFFVYASNQWLSIFHHQDDDDVPPISPSFW